MAREILKTFIDHLILIFTTLVFYSQELLVMIIKIGYCLEKVCCYFCITKIYKRFLFCLTKEAKLKWKFKHLPNKKTQKRCLALDAFWLASKKYCSFKSRAGANNAHQIHYSELNVLTQSYNRGNVQSTVVTSCFSEESKDKDGVRKDGKTQGNQKINNKISS